MDALKRLSALLSILAGPVAADGCDDLWFTRNLIMDRAGYCFATPLGQSVFDNADCTGKAVTLAPDAKRVVDTVRALENARACRVDTSRSSLDLADAFVRRYLDDLPVLGDFESACLGYEGPPVPLRAGASPEAPSLGEITHGDYVNFSHMRRDGWAYVTTYAPGQAVRSGGWTDADLSASCVQWAG